MKADRLVLAWCVLLAGVGPAFAQETPDTGNYVSREEYEALKKEVEELKATIAALQTPPATQPAEEPEARYQELRDRVTQDILAKLPGEMSGTTLWMIVGDASAGFISPDDADSTFTVDFSPLFLWQLQERLFLEAGVDFSLSNDPNGDNAETNVDLGPADISYLLNDYVAIVGGQFPVPFGMYHTHLDPPWINKFPDDPLPFGDNGISPDLGLGVMATGAFPVGPTKFNYGVYVANGPVVLTSDSDTAGSLSFEDWNDVNNNKSVGGRIGFLPIPSLEIGYSIQCARVNPDGFHEVNALLQALDLNFVRDFAPLQGRVTVRSEWVWSNVDKATYLPQPPLGLGRRFDNDRNGGYVELAYRPSMLESKILRKLEFAVRYDILRASGQAPGGGTEHRWAVGLDYWINPNAVIKTAYVIDDKESGPDQNVVMVQVGIGI